MFLLKSIFRKKCDRKILLKNVFVNLTSDSSRKEDDVHLRDLSLSTYVCTVRVRCQKIKKFK